MIVTTGGRVEVLWPVHLGGHAGLVRLIFALANGLEAELAGNELDLVEVEALVDGHHQSEILEGEGHDLGGRHLENLRELADGDELVDANGLPLALRLGGASSLELLARAAPEVAGRAARGRA